MNFCVMPFDEFSWWHTRFRRRLLDFLSVLIDAGQKENVFTFEPMIARDHIGQHFFVSVADMRWRIRVIDRRRDEKFFWHLCDTLPNEPLYGKRIKERRLGEPSISNLTAGKPSLLGIHRSTKRALSSKCRFVPSSYSGLPLIL